MKKYLVIIMSIIITLSIISCTVQPNNPNEPSGAYYFHFASDLESWVITSWGGVSDGFVTAAYNGDPAFSADGTTGSAEIACAFGTTETSTSSVKWFMRTITKTDMANRLIGARIYIPSDMASLNPGYSATFAIHTTDGYMLQTSKTLDQTGWNYYYTTITAGTALESSDSVSIIVAKSLSYTADWSGNIYIDEVYWR